MTRPHDCIDWGLVVAAVFVLVVGLGGAVLVAVTSP